MTVPGVSGGAKIKDDLIQPFLLEVPNLRGRLIRLGPVVDTIIARHDYPAPVADLLGEMLGLTALLASMLKFDGVFTLQTKSDGAIPLLVSDVTTEGELRGYAEFKEDRLAAVAGSNGGAAVEAAPVLGKGHLALTVDQGPDTERYQGIVELQDGDLTESVQHYFRQSEQLKTGLTVAAGRGANGWRAGGLLLQQMPEDERDGIALGSGEEDDWRRSQVLMSTCTDQELLDPTLPANDLLYRLFHEERVRVHAPRPVTLGCRCSVERIERILRSLDPAELADLKTDEGLVVVTCQFCNVGYSFSDEDLARIFAT